LHLSRDTLATRDTFQKFILWSYVCEYWDQHVEKVANESLPKAIESRVAELFDRNSLAFLNLCRIGNPKSGGVSGGPKWDLQPGQVCPPLFYCASLASLWPTRYLVKNGEIMDEVTDYDGDHNGFALQNAIMERNTEIAKFLLHRGANANAQGGFYGNALQAAAVRGDTEIIQLLLNRGADVNARGGFYGNALQAAAVRGDTEIIQLLLDRGADVNARGRFHGNVLQAAAVRGNTEIVQLLLGRGADVNNRGEIYGNAVQAAAAHANYDVAKFLHSHGAEVDPPGAEWEDMLSRLGKRFHGAEQVVRLKEFQADPTGFLWRGVF
jgi:hypothetical protein